MSSQVSALDGASRASRVRRSLGRFSSLLSLRYLMLRCFTAATAVASGLVQTFVFARVLTPKDFSIYILIGSIGVALWLFDLGGSKILFVRQRQCHIAQRSDPAIAAQATAVMLLYMLIVLAATALCFVVGEVWIGGTAEESLQYAAFFSFSTFNLVWFPMRNISNAIDQFLAFETLESVRRVAHLGSTLILLVGVPLWGFLISANLVWLAMFAICFVRLAERRAVVPRLRGWWTALRAFWGANRAEILRSSNYQVGELAVYNFPYFVVPAVFGLGAPTIILDTVFKVFRGATLIYAAGLDPLVPRQTRAYADGDLATLKKATWTAAFLCAVPTFTLCAILFVAGDWLFALLLGHAATVPRTATLILIVLLLANLAQNVASCLLLHTGFFHDIARVATFLVISMAAMTIVVIVSGASIVGFIGGYAAVYVVGAALYVIYTVHRIFVRVR
jgi:O-antigen/teichoic acid export membrane protein